MVTEDYPNQSDDNRTTESIDSDELDRLTFLQIVDAVESELRAEDKLGASRDQIVSGTCSRIRRRIREKTSDTLMEESNE